MPLSKDDIDAVAITLEIDRNPAFLIMLTRGGMTKRRGSSGTYDPDALTIKAGTDGVFEAFLASIPDAVLAGEGGRLEDGGSDGPRHDWHFEFGGGIQSLEYDIAYHAGSASLPDEFADMVVVAERLTHSWYSAAVAEERGEPAPSTAASVPAAPPPKPVAAPRGRSGQPARGTRRGGAAVPQGTLPPTRERLAIAILLDFMAFMVPFSLFAGLFGGSGERAGPPGAGVVLFAIAEFALLMIARRSPGYWLLGITAPAVGKPVVDARWPARETPLGLATAIGLCGVGVLGLTSWTVYHAPIPYFGVGLPIWLSIPLSVLGSLASIVGGALILRGDPRGVLVGGGTALLALMAAGAGWSGWGSFVEQSLALHAEATGRGLGATVAGLARTLVPIALLVVPAALAAGCGYELWRRYRPPAPDSRAATAR